VDDGKPVRTDTAFDAVVYLLRCHCTAEQIQAIRLNVGRDILNHLEIVSYEYDDAGHTTERRTEPPAATARRHRANGKAHGGVHSG